MPEDESQAVHQPHDKLFKSGFSDPATAAAFLSCQLPAAVSTRIDWSELQLQPGSFVDSQFRHSESDLLYSAPVAGAGGLVGTGALIYPKNGDGVTIRRQSRRIFGCFLRVRGLPSAGEELGGFRGKLAKPFTA